MARKGWEVGILFGVLFTTACGGGANGCPVPPKGAETGTLQVAHLHEFGRNYQMFEVAYKVDDCILFNTSDTSVLRQQKADLGSHVLLAGDHQLKIMVRFESDFGADMHRYSWWYTQGAQVTVPAGGSVALKVRFYEDETADPRQRMRSDITLEPGETAVASAEDGPAAP